MFHVATKVKPLDGMLIEVEFAEGEKRLYDVSQLVDVFPCFKRLTDRSLFEKVRVDTGGYGLVWNSEIDLSVEDVWWDGQPVD